MKKAFHAFVKVRSSAELNLSWAGPGDLVKKRIFETGSESRQALVNRSVTDIRTTTGQSNV